MSTVDNSVSGVANLTWLEIGDQLENEEYNEREFKQQYLFSVLQETLANIDKGHPIPELIPEVISEMAQKVSSPVCFEEYEKVD